MMSRASVPIEVKCAPPSEKHAPTPLWRQYRRSGTRKDGQDVNFQRHHRPNIHAQGISAREAKTL